MLILLDFIFPNYSGACLYKVSQPCNELPLCLYEKGGWLACLPRSRLLKPRYHQARQPASSYKNNEIFNSRASR